MWFGKSADDFNSGLEELGAQAPHLVAEIGNGFTSTFCYKYTGQVFSDFLLI